MAVTYKQIASVTVGSGGAADIEFTSIPGTYTDLVLFFSTRTTRSAVQDAIFLRFNNDTASNYSYRFLRGGGGSADSGSASTTFIYINQTSADTATASTFGNGFIYIPNYTASTNKSLSIDSVGENNAAEAYATLIAGLWSNSAAITSIKIYPETGPNFSQHSTATLYGIRKS